MCKSPQKDTFLRSNLKLSLLDFGPKIIAFQLNHFAHFVEPRTQANSNALLQSLLRRQACAISDCPCVRHAIFKVRRYYGGQLSVIAGVEDIGESVADPLGRALSPEIV